MIYFGLKPIAKFLRMKDALAFSSSSMSQVIKSLFANGEQGFAFNFNDLSTMYQDSAGTIPVTGVGQPVGKVLDKSGRGNHATQSTSAKRPILQKNATTGAYYLAFDGVDDCLMTVNVDLSALNSMTLITAFKKMTGSSRAIVTEFGTNTESATGSFSIEAPSAGLNNLALRLNTASTNNLLTTAVQYPITAILSAKILLLTSISMRVNGKIVGNNSASGGNFSNYPIYIGMRAGTSLPFSGDLYNIIGIARLATDTEITNTENAIAKNVGVTL